MHVLTIFEYLRNRAYQAIVGGVHDAVEALEKDGHIPGDAVSGAGPQNTETTLGQIVRVTGALAAPNSNEEADTPGPRRRGRPKKGEKRS